MTRYSVTVPIAGYAIVEVEAADENDAIDEALGAIDFNDIQEWEAYRHLVRGHVCSAPYHKAVVEEIEGDDE
ncbi:hypothetical protein [Bradyrhizobium sp. Tv2a-2]|uniref:hypothetical protein n=1 Tax=Bradyrhizobium sp. Tv2a-2 TaxID=113395 RepID=UPI00040C1159|nr:hypothetical protein [Bradyrhizobium sp. Tv2a-2]